MGKFSLLLSTHLKVVYRNRTALFFTLLFPLIFIGIMGIAFQEGDPTNSTISIGIINHDQGIPENAIVLQSNGSLLHGKDFSHRYVKLLKSLTYESGKTIFEIQQYDNFPKQDLQRRDIKAVVSIPDNFSLSMMASIRASVNLTAQTNNWQSYPPANYSSSIQIKGDTAILEFTVASTIIEEVTRKYTAPMNDLRTINIEISGRKTTDFSIFDRTVPGLVIFSIISNASTVSSVALADVESNRLDRLRLTKIRPWQYTLALITSQQIVAMAQIPIMFGAAVFFGFPLTWRILYAFLFVVFVSAAITGIGILLAGLLSNAEAVGGLSAIVTTPMAFLAGAFFAVPNPVLIKKGSFLGAHSLGIFDLLPPKPAITGLRLILIEGYTLREVWFELILTVFLSILYLLIGIVIYNRRHLRID